MEIQNQFKLLAEKINLLKNKIETEESTKHAFVLPFINILGYDTFNPTEVVPEFTADLGLKKGEKVDYAIFQDDKPILIIECKHWAENLNVHNSQLFRYFHVTKTRFSLLTNGIEYRFYTDLEEPNKMDEKPFFEFSITNLKDNTLNEILKFHKTNFDVDKIFSNAGFLKYTKEIKQIIHEELQSPSDGFIRLFAGKVYNGRLTEKVLDEFRDIVYKAFSQYVGENINERLTAALNKENQKQKEENRSSETVSKINTTDEELEAFRMIVAILRRKLPVERISYRDTQSYFGILLDDNNRKPVCRLYLNGTKKQIGIFDSQKNEQREQIGSIDDIYSFEEKLLTAVDNYDEIKNNLIS